MSVFSAQMAIQEISSDTFISLNGLERMGNGAPIAYGGSTASLAVHAAIKTVPSHMHVYTVFGAFHGPARLDRKVICRVTRTRDTKTFASRRVVALQTTDNGTERPCMDITVEFQVSEPALYDFSAAPNQPYFAYGPLHPQKTATSEELRDRLLASGDVTPDMAEAVEKMFASGRKFFEVRYSTDGIAGQNLNGFAKHAQTTQEHLSMPEKFSAEWYRVKEPPRGDVETVGVITFLMDGGLSFLPLISDHKLFEDAAACSTLDFALRIVRPGVDLTGWMLKERKMIGAAMGRTYTENRLWDEQGNLVAVETQTCIVRPLPPEKKTAKQAKI